ncbi:MAG TPA: hypothetical protein VN408_04830 [Actinoplanes sp.]|nr:hypothetical protein [Actinoplanes sp.]
MRLAVLMLPAALAVACSPPATTVPPATASTAATPEPFVQTFADQPGARPLSRLPSPTTTVSMPVNVDGCDRSYGTRSQCVPRNLPPGVTDVCTWLRDRGFLDRPLTARTPDRHHLDTDTNGFACDP